ncbi:YdcF family protein [uncultured Roseibium sp.]|uniref:YdcF family protein n=1 Tax=uncultured Roseibium sp. TaxID=1936171 RepID=UPI00261BC129|nr:YdcF family protein [uncultured Roseibium sp.]
MNSIIREAARLLWQFHCVYDPLEPADLVVGLGSYDLRVADRCADLFHEGLADRIVFTGAAGNWTQDLYSTSEAEAFSARAQELDVPHTAIVTETTATNIGENIRFAAQIVPEASQVIFVTKPQTQRRCQATVLKQWPDVKGLVTAPLTSYEDQPTLAHDERALICEMVGDLERIRTYPVLGFQSEVVIPDGVAQAFETLVDAGYTDHLPRGA